MSATARLVREPLACTPAPQVVLRLLSAERLPFALCGAWAGGGAIVGSEPLAVADVADDPFEILDLLPGVDASAVAGIDPGIDAAGSPSASAVPGVDAPRGRQAAGAASAPVGGGWFGWLGFRLSARVEDVPLAPWRPVALPDFHLAYYDHVLRRDLAGRWWFEALETEARREALAARREHLARLLARAAGERAPRPRSAPRALELERGDAAHHLDAVADCRARIASGEIFQANLCLRLEGLFDGTAAELLGSALSRISPPYAAAFDTPAGAIASLSPELFLRRRGRDVVTGPIKGTLERERDPVRAAAALRALRRSAKDAAEHVMIVDLMRNDLGRVCEYGTVQAPRRPSAEAHPGVWHLVSYVRGRLRAQVGDAQLLRATFPPGSVTGAPKVQSLKVIARLERCGREVYTGSVGFSSPVAGLELSVAIRTLELCAGRLWLGAGGGIVADSDPRRELKEALAKARPIAAAVGARVRVRAGAR
ncbi:MAG TPA: chorismate-binding protein [Solirubrobacteraceae bacterium]|nr:chorismate-binding protein [Solirubrobacteraceae bacterium]